MRSALRILTASAVTAVCLCLTPSTFQHAEAASGVGASNVDLKTTLEKGLRARRKSEFQYISHVVGMVNSGALPRSLVESTFLWARKEARAKQSYPFIYFERGLKLRAKKIGVQV